MNILDKLLPLSGFLLIIISWLTMILPYYLIGGGPKKLNTISDTAKVPKYGWVINIGILLTGSSQILFLIYLANLANFNIFTLGGAYLLGSASLILAAFFSTKNAPKFHSIFIKIYFISILVGVSIISYLLSSVSTKLSLILYIILILMTLGQLMLFIKKKLAYAEMWSLICASIWALAIYAAVYGIF